MPALPVIAIIDVGKTNKKLFLFDQNYKIVFERSARFTETIDDDGFVCENVESLRLSVFESFREVLSNKDFDVRAINFSAYGATLVNIDKDGNPVTPLYNYLKPYPEDLQKQFYDMYGGVEQFSYIAASPVLGHLNSGMQLYWLKHCKPEAYKKIWYSLHLPQYISYLISGKCYSDLTSIGCHTNLWDFYKDDYHQWVYNEGIIEKLAPVVSGDHVEKIEFEGYNCVAGVGLHDSSAALIPYLLNFHETFVLISTGTWCISLNPFNSQPLTKDELECDCLTFISYQGKPVKASRLFAGNEHETQLKRISDHFNQSTGYYKTVEYDANIIADINSKNKEIDNGVLAMAEAKVLLTTPLFANRDLNAYVSFEEAYHQLIADIVTQQFVSTNLILKGSPVKRIFVDGGFSKNSIYMNLLAAAFPELEVFAASMAQATALGTALAIHHAWNDKALPNDLIELKYYSVHQNVSL